MAVTPSKQTNTAPENTSVVDAPTTAAETGQTQVYFVPDYNVSVEATSLEEAISLAKKAKGKK